MQKKFYGIVGEYTIVQQLSSSTSLTENAFFSILSSGSPGFQTSGDRDRQIVLIGKNPDSLAPIALHVTIHPQYGS